MLDIAILNGVRTPFARAFGPLANVPAQDLGRIAATAGRLHALSPLATLARGYAIAQGDDGRTLASIDAFAPAAEFDLRLRDGSVRSTVKSISATDRRAEA